MSLLKREDKRPYLYSKSEPGILHLELWALYFMKNVDKADGVQSREKDNNHEDGGIAL